MAVVGFGAKKDRMLRILNIAEAERKKQKSYFESASSAANELQPADNQLLYVGGFACILFMNVAGAPEGVRAYIGEVTRLVERVSDGAKPNPLKLGVDITNLKPTYFGTCSWFKPAGEVIDKHEDASEYVFTPNEFVQDNIEEWNASDLICCPEMNYNVEKNVWVIREADRLHIIEWLKRTRDGIMDGMIETTDVRKVTSRKRKNENGGKAESKRKKVEEELEMEIEEEAEKVPENRVGKRNVRKSKKG